MKKFLFLLILLWTAFNVLAQERQITGTVKDKNTGQELPGVSILLRGTKIATQTDVNGKFSIRAPQTGAVELEARFLGFATQIVKVNGTGPVNIEMQDEAKGLDEVVVIGYGTVRKRDLTGAVTSIKSDEIREVPAQNPMESIQGKVAGVDITRSNGSSSSGVNIRIRGNRSLINPAANSPLFIVDGIQTGNINDLNPNNIESIEFLKDASSTAIYGWQGANGVVIVTTKKGTGGAPKVSFNSYYGVSQVSRYPRVMSGPEFVAIKREANRAAGKWNSPADDPKIFTIAGEYDAVQNNQWVDYQKELFHNGAQQDYNVGVSAGTDKTKMFFSANYFREKGVLKFDDARRYSLRANIDQNLGKWVKVGLQSQFTNRDESYRRDPLNMANKIIPLGTVYDAQGNFVLDPMGSRSPLADEQPNAFSNTGKITNVIANGYLELAPFTGFTFRSNLGTSIGGTRNGLFEGQNSISRATSSGSLARYNTENSRFVNWDNVATYQKSIKDHSFTVTALTSFIESLEEVGSVEGERQLLPSQSFYGLGNTASDGRKVFATYERWNSLSFAGRLNYSYKGKYLLTLTNRVDGASRLSEGNKWASFPSAAVAWRISDENFMNSVPNISDLKLRFTYGVAGQSGIDPYGTQSLLQRVPMAFGDKDFQGFTFAPRIGNPDTGWELSATTNLGLDVGLWNNRISATLDVYDTRTTDLLLEKALPPTTGVQRVYQNIGETRNRGIELGINSTNIQKKDFSWTSTLTYSRNNEEIVSLVADGVNDIANGWFTGHPTQVFYDYEKIGIWQTNEAVEAAKYGRIPGDIKVRDVNGDGKIDNTNDRKVIAGDNRPEWFGGFDNRVTYKKFDLNLYLFARWGQMINPSFLGRYDRQSNLGNSSRAINYWTPENPTNEYPRPHANFSGGSMPGWTSMGIVDGSYMRIRNISLGYTIPAIKSLPVSSIRVYAQGTNLFTWTKSPKLKEYDPERGGGESSPMLKTVVFGINIGF